MKIEQNARVVTAEGKAVGHVDRFVMNPRTREVTHLVVRQGLLFTEDHVLPIDLVARTTDDEVVLREDAGALEQLPLYEETYYVPLNESERSRLPSPSYIPPYYWYPPFPAAGLGLYDPGYTMPQYIEHTKTNIPEGAVPLAEGARVISADGEHVGNVEQVLTDPQADRATHFLISAGLLFKTRKLVPTEWIASLGADEVHLAVGSDFLDQLREYEPQSA
jgi:uncharacterized protein YrrD